MTVLLGKKEAQVTTNAYTDIVSLQIPPGVSKLSVQLTELNVNNTKYKIIAGMDGSSYPYEITAETALNKNATIVETPTSNSKLADPMLYVKVQIKDAVDGVHGSVSCWVASS